jgi:hypothetical protein
MNALPARRLISAILTMLGALVSALMFMSVPVLAGVPVVSNEHVSEVTSVGAHLGGTIDPGEEETSYYFEYGTVPYTSPTAHGAKTPNTPLLASDNAGHPASAVIVGLAAGEYHYRLVASSSAGTVYGPDEVFSTEATMVAGLPDGRQYELVSPPEKDGAQIYGGGTGRSGVLLGGTSAVQASAEGTAITYMASAPVGSDPVGNANDSQVFSRRTPTGWESQDISPYNPEPLATNVNDGEPYRYFSPDLAQGVLQEPGGPVLLRDDTTGTFSTAIAVGTLPPHVEFLDGTADLSHLVVNDGGYRAPDLYEWAAGHLAQVNVLKGGASVPDGQLGGYAKGRRDIPSELSGRYALSSDGRYVVWGTETELFSSDMLAGETVQVDAAQGGRTSGGGRFQLANSAGTRVFFTDANELTPSAAPGGLYMFNILGKPHGQLEDLTPGPQGGGVSEVLGANTQATSLYVLSTSVLTANENERKEDAVPGANNIFLLREASVGSGTWTTTFIATLSNADSGPYLSISGEHALPEIPVRVSENGVFMAFMSDRSLTGYDNTDVTSTFPCGAPQGICDQEVFLYDTETGKLVCASCDPTGARPAGEFETGAYPGLPDDPTFVWEGQWLAGVIPGWNENLTQGAEHVQGEVALYASRVLSDSGRLFFDSPDNLVPTDVNGRVDVYEYEPDGEGSCPAGGSGCVALISSGHGNGDSVFVDASVGGNDVFFTAPDRLVLADVDAATDMYDAHACTAGVPCFPASTVTSPPCDSTDACRAAQSPQPGVFGAAASATFSGVGNVAPLPTPAVKSKAKPVRCRKGFVKKHNRCVKTKKSKRAGKAGDKRGATS